MSRGVEKRQGGTCHNVLIKVEEGIMGDPLILGGGMWVGGDDVVKSSRQDVLFLFLTGVGPDECIGRDGGCRDMHPIPYPQLENLDQGVL